MRSLSRFSACELRSSSCLSLHHARSDSANPLAHTGSGLTCSPDTLYKLFAQGYSWASVITYGDALFEPDLEGSLQLLRFGGRHAGECLLCPLQGLLVGRQFLLGLGKGMQLCEHGAAHIA